ncbi:hypothetical protein EDB85DRAFT_2291550 [Lactarius pseudohatsudake]|nr:hypothetical protein EDB85DRAFT_2291550 [Lactarius pseudohatsudake]
MACAACAFLPGARHPSKASAAFVSPPSTSSFRAPSALALGATSPYSKPSCAISTPIFLHREIAAGTSWRPASGRRFFWLRKAHLAILGGADAWYGSSEEIEFSIDNGGVEVALMLMSTIHTPLRRCTSPHLLRVLGPSSLTLYEHVLGRRRILIIRICPSKRRFLCQVVADMYFEDDSHDPGEGPNIAPELTEVRERKEKVVKPEDPDDPTSNCVFCTLLPISAPLQHSSTARRGDPRAPTS